MEIQRNEAVRHALANKYMTDGTRGEIPFGAPRGRARIPIFLNHLKMMSIATYVVDANNSHRHRQRTEEQLEEAGIGIDLVRLSNGIENTADIISELYRVLAAVQE